MFPRCCVCETRITPQFWFCSECEDEYETARPIELWDDWLVFMYRSERDRRYSEIIINENEINFSDLG